MGDKEGRYTVVGSKWNQALTIDSRWGMKSEQYRYEIIIYRSEEDQAFIAEVPELPGCAADGSTYQKALSNVQVIISEWLDTAKELGRAIPEPKGRLMYA